MTNNEMRHDLRQVEYRLAELRQDRDKVSKEMDAERARFIAKQSPIEDVQAVQSKLLVLEASIADLETKREEFDAKVNSPEALTARQQERDALRTMAEHAESLHRKVVELRGDIEAVLKDTGRAYVESMLEFMTKQSEFSTAVVTYDPALSGGILRLPIEKTPYLNRVKAELAECGLEKETFDLLARPNIVMPPSEFGIIYETIEQYHFRKTREASAAS